MVDMDYGGYANVFSLACPRHVSFVFSVGKPISPRRVPGCQAARGGRVPAGGLGPEPRRLPGAPGRRRRGDGGATGCAETWPGGSEGLVAYRHLLDRLLTSLGRFWEDHVSGNKSKPFGQLHSRRAKLFDPVWFSLIVPSQQTLTSCRATNVEMLVTRSEG